MNYCRIKSINSPLYDNCIYFAKLYEERFTSIGKRNASIILDDKNNKVIVNNEIEYSMPDDIYLNLYKELTEYRKTLK